MLKGAYSSFVVFQAAIGFEIVVPLILSLLMQDGLLKRVTSCALNTLALITYVSQNTLKESDNPTDPPILGERSLKNARTRAYTFAVFACASITAMTITCLFSRINSPSPSGVLSNALLTYNTYMAYRRMF